MQIALYFVSLFALLAGVSSAQGERRRVATDVYATGAARQLCRSAKFIAYLSIFAAVLLLLFIPAAIASAHGQAIVSLYLQNAPARGDISRARPDARFFRQRSRAGA